jgi:hypothetical protein
MFVVFAHPATGCVNLKHFRTTEGPFHEVEPFLRWITATQIFFATKGVFHDTKKILLVGSLVRETNTLSFYANGIDSFLPLSWAAFKDRLFDFALPPLWRTDL